MSRPRIKTGVLALLATVVATLGTGLSATVATASPAPVVNSPIEFYANPPFAISMTSDPAGNIYYVDNNGRLFEIAANDPTGTAIQLAPSTNFQSNENIAYFDGYLYVSSYSGPNEVWKVSLDGTSVQPYMVGTGNGPDPEGLAFDAAGNMYIADGDYNEIWMVPAGGGTPVVIASGLPGGYPWGMTIRGSTLYIVDDNAGTVLSVPTSGGTPTTIFSDPTYNSTYSITTDPAGNIFALLGNYPGPGAIMEIPAGSETPQILNLPGLPVSSNPYGGITWANGYIYFENNNNNGTFYRFADPVAPSTPLNLSVLRQPTTITGSWTGVANATSYTCTLLYGYHDLSNFTINTLTNNCTFSGLDMSTVYGVRVTANIGTISSAPTSGFAPLAKWSITCVKGKSTKKVTAVNPRCPVGYRLKP